MGTTQDTSRGLFWPLSVIVIGVGIIFLVLLCPTSPAADHAEAIPDDSQGPLANQVEVVPYPETQTAIAGGTQTAVARTATAAAIQTQTYPLTEQAAQQIRAQRTAWAEQTATALAATHQAATATSVAHQVEASTDTPTTVPTPSDTATLPPTPTRRSSLPTSTPSDSTPTYTPTPTEIGARFLANGSTHECLIGSPFIVVGKDAPPRTTLLLAFDGRIVGGGISDSEGVYTMPLTLGEERPGSYLVHVLLRQSREPILSFTCTVRAPASIPPLPRHPWN